MKNIYLFIILLFIVSSVQKIIAQSIQLEWENDISSEYFAFFPSDIITDNDGNIYTVGGFNTGALTFEQYISNTNPNAEPIQNEYPGVNKGIYITKYNGQGDILWAKSFGSGKHDSVANITIDASGNIYITGGFMGTSISFDNIILSNTYNHESIYIVKLTSEGNVVWAKSLQGTLQSSVDITGLHYTTVAGVKVNSEGNVIIAGKFTTSLNFDGNSFNVTEPNDYSETSMYVIKYDSNGIVINSKKNNAVLGYSMINFISMDNNDNLYVGGYYFNGNTNQAGQYSLTIDDYTLPFTTEIPTWGESVSNSGFIVKFDSAGNVLWGNNVSYMDDFVADRYGNVITVVNHFTTNYVIKIIKYNTNGNITWEKEINLNQDIWEYDIVTDVGGNVFLSGSNSNNFTVDNINIGTMGQFGSAFILKCNPAGIAQWAFGFKGADSKVVSNSDGNIYITGRLHAHSSIFGPEDPEKAGFYLAKFSGDSIPVIPEEQQSEEPTIPTSYAFAIYPNPVNNILNISRDKDDTIYNVALYNTLGQTIITKTNQSQKRDFTIDMSQLQAGYYMLEVNKKSGRSSHKIIKK